MHNKIIQNLVLISMEIFIIKTKLIQKEFDGIRKILKASGNYRPTVQLQLTVMDGQIEISGPGFVVHLPAETTGNVRISMSAMKWDMLVKDYHRDKFEAVVSPGEVMIGSTTMNVTTLFFDKEKPFRSISIPANPKSLEIIKLAYGDYSDDELQYNDIDWKIDEAEIEFKSAVEHCGRILAKHGIGEKAFKTLIKNYVREKYKIDFNWFRS